VSGPAKKRRNQTTSFGGVIFPSGPSATGTHPARGGSRDALGIHAAHAAGTTYRLVGQLSNCILLNLHPDLLLKQTESHR
jgi:hypothetical protein